MSLQIVTFGCRLNAFESDVMRGHAAALTDTVVVNTCAVTAEAERQARAAIARIHREQPGISIVVTGCAAQIAPQRWAALPGVARVLGNADKLLPDTWDRQTPFQVSDIMRAQHAPAYPMAISEGRSRALLQVQQGCDHRCTFCVIPFGRGPNRSVSPDILSDRVRTLVAAGTREVVLTGVDIASYGGDLAGRPTLGWMIRRLLTMAPDLPRLRLSSLDPAAIDMDLWELIGDEERLMPHLHLSLQSASDLILKRMKRRHSVADAAASIARARTLRPGIAIGADLIAGFPTETDALFEDTRAFVRDHALPYLHVFPYSERPDTPAARMPAVPHSVRRARAAVLRAEGLQAAAAFHHAQLGRLTQVLTEAGRPGGMNGRTPHFTPVRLAGVWAPSQLVTCRITGYDTTGLLAEAA
jgi:threonylcarbamoyladenosine tRNA methylthiotransferase MtaB